MEFIDKNTYAANGFYAAPNEGTREWRKLVTGVPLQRAAGICSSGEVGLFSILPSVRRKLVLIDHSYTSLNVAMTKYLLLVKHGPKEVHHLFTKAKHKEVSDACFAVRKQLPEVLRDCTGKKSYENDWCAMTVKEEYYDSSYNNGYGRYSYREVPTQHNYYIEEIQRHWNKHISLDLVRKAYKKLHLVTFVHGDLQDLAEFGPFDLVYVSNALEHSNRDRQHPSLAQVRACLRPKGYVILAGRAYANTRYNYSTHRYEPVVNPELVEVKKAVDGGGGSMNWKQALYQLPEQQAAAA